jgi:hypothetical protein
MKLTPNFTLEELVITQHRWVDNNPRGDVVANLQILASRLEDVRLLLGKPIIITSGYRSEVLNRLIGGSATSKHMIGLAADFICPGFGTPLEVCRKIADSDLDFDQLINENSWVHFGLSDSPMRKQILTALPGGRFMQGLTERVEKA